MTTRHFLFTTAFSIAAIAPLAAPIARAQETATAVPEVANGKRSLIGKINTNAVYIRSGPGDNYYPTTKLDMGAEVTVVGEKPEWLKIAPPEGSFSYVGKNYIEKNADGTGTVIKEEVNVRTGSTLNAMKTSIQTKLDRGTKVQIIDEKDDYYLIKPPADAYVYVSKQYVDPVREAIAQQPTGTGTGLVHEAPKSDGNTTPPEQFTGDSLAARPTTAPSGERIASAKASTQPSVDLQFDTLETQFAATSGQKIEEQPVKELLTSYQKLLADPALPESMKRVADFRIRALTARNESKEQIVVVQKMQDEAKKRQVALKAEQEEIAQQIKKNNVTLYAAVGTLRTSSMQNDKTTLYRLTDPETGRTVVYIRSSDPKYATLIGKFIGVKGEITTEQALSMKVVNPTDVAEVAQTEVFKSIGAQIVPPSILPQAAQQASTGNQ
jgi:uncharacterized protein YgiM (DUF1202 family)